MVLQTDKALDTVVRFLVGCDWRSRDKVLANVKMQLQIVVEAVEQELLKEVMDRRGSKRRGDPFESKLIALSG